MYQYRTLEKWMNKWYLTLQNIFSSSSSSLFLQQLNFSISDTSSSDFAYILPYLQATFVFIVIYVLTNIYIYIYWFHKVCPIQLFFSISSTNTTKIFYVSYLSRFSAYSFFTCLCSFTENYIPLSFFLSHKTL